MVAGNVAEDRAPGGWAPGGPSLYTARMCVALGARVTLLSAIPPGYPAEALAGIDDDQSHPGRFDKLTLDLLRLTLAQQPVVDEHAGELVTDGPLHERRGDR